MGTASVWWVLVSTQKSARRRTPPQFTHVLSIKESCTTGILSPSPIIVMRPQDTRVVDQIAFAVVVWASCLPVVSAQCDG